MGYGMVVPKQSQDVKLEPHGGGNPKPRARRTAKSEVTTRPARISSHPRQCRRRWARLPLALPVFVRGVDELGNNFMEFTAGFNINPGGMLLVMQRWIAPERPVELEIPYGMPNRPPRGLRFERYLRARIVHHDSSAGLWLYSVAFNPPLIQGQSELPISAKARR